MTIEALKKKHKSPKRGFGAVKTMREIRDKLSLEIQDMTYEEQREYLDKLLAKGKSIAK